MTAATGGHGLTGIADAGAFLARLTRLDPRALVRLRRVGATGRTALWACLPWGVLVARTVTGTGPVDATVSAAALLAELSAGRPALPPRRDPDWRHSLPPSGGRLVERLPGSELRRLAEVAAGTLRAAATAGVRGRAVGQRALRDALLDHVAIVVTESGTESANEAGRRLEVPQRLVQAIVQMGFLGPGPGSGSPGEWEHPDDTVQVRTIGQWVGLSARYGIAWLRTVDKLRLSPHLSHPNG